MRFLPVEIVQDAVVHAHESETSGGAIDLDAVIRLEQALTP